MKAGTAQALLIAMAAAAPTAGMAQSCKSSGGLAFLGTTTDETRTVWLSGTGVGSYSLEAAQGNQTVDTWSRARRGVHLSASPVVSNGNGGTHKLYETSDGKPCLIDTRNQQGGFKIPPNLTLPMATLPGRLLPPIGKLFPDFQGPTLPNARPPVSGVTPAMPGGISPPIASLPPTGITPTRPSFSRPPSGAMPTALGGIAPPIATLPPSGITPTRPGSVSPPIGTRPPSGAMPTRPGLSRPPSGAMPTAPGGIAPPIATLPPSGITPTRPGSVSPPIGTRPPSGAMPTRPGLSRPPSGAMPTAPGGIAPPIATLPPSGLTPALPGGVSPPIGTRPPVGVTPNLPDSRPPSGVMPEIPGRVAPPIVTGRPEGLVPSLPTDVRPPAAPGPSGSAEVNKPGGQQQRDQARPNRLESDAAVGDCFDPRSSERPRVRRRASKPLCADARPMAAPFVQGAPGPQVPITPGRDLGAPTLWNSWTDMRIIATSDQRYGLDVKTMLGSFVFGADRQITDDLVAGMSVSLEGSRTSGFDGFLKSTANGINVGPYVAVRLTPNWAIDAALTYGAYENHLELRSMEGRYLSQRFSGALTLHGQYMLGDVYFRPKAVLSYSHNVSDAYRLSGQVLNIPIHLRMPDSSFNFGLLESSVEISRLFTLSGGNAVIPYIEVGAKYEFDRPSGGQILTGDLSLATPSRWSYSGRTGIRALLSNAVQVEASAGYLSFGQKDLNVWEGRLNLSYRF